MILKLEYTITQAERKEAQSLHLRHHYGGGSKWRTQLVLLGMLAVTLGLGWLQFRFEVKPEDRGWFSKMAAAIFVIVFVAFFFFKRMTRKTKDCPMRLELSERELVLNAGSGRTAIAWSAFKECLESPTLFTLVDRTNLLLYVVPKRAFPDESSQNWFRSLANQPKSVAATDTPEAIAPGRFAGKGVTLTLQLKYRDYLTRMLTSWRMRGISIVIGGIMLGISLKSFINPPPDAVVPPWKVFLWMTAMMIPMFTVIFFVVAFTSWRSERKFLTQQHIALSNDGLEFASSDATGLLPWTTYKYYLENRWAFFIWQPRGSLWLMFPKRDFASPLDLEQCRTLFQTQLKRSRWFYM